MQSRCGARRATAHIDMGYIILWHCSATNVVSCIGHMIYWADCILLLLMWIYDQYSLYSMSAIWLRFDWIKVCWPARRCQWAGCACWICVLSPLGSSWCQLSCSGSWSPAVWSPPAWQSQNTCISSRWGYGGVHQLFSILKRLSTLQWKVKLRTAWGQ